jgi:alpha-tubulin suppressor-like RCC1 family protein
VITADERVACWGTDSAGELGDGDTVAPPGGGPRTVVDASGQPLTGVKAVSLGDAFSCASTATEVHCWGNNTYGQLAQAGGDKGAGIYTYVRRYAVVAPGAPAGAIAAGYSAAISASASQACGWGWNSGGHRYWPVSDMPQTTPICLPIAGVKQAGMGYNGACFLMNNGDVSCWGYDLGVKDAPGGRVGIGPATHLATGQQHICALQTDGRVFCWGKGQEGELGNGPYMGGYLIHPPEEVKALGADVVGIGSGPSASHTCAIMRDGSLQCWGRNTEGQLGNGTATPTTGPVPVKW